MSEKREYTPKEKLIHRIIKEEYRMFSKVQNMGGRASCQDDFETFYIMRFAQHSIFGMNTLERYMKDIQEAQTAGRNLVTEKYSWMMEETDPVYFAGKLKPYLPEVGGRKKVLVDSITDVFMNCYDALKTDCPNLMASGRNPYNSQGGVSIRLYFSSELKTWTEAALLMACQDMIAHLERHSNPVRMIYEKTVFFYGYQTLEAAEEAMGRTN